MTLEDRIADEMVQDRKAALEAAFDDVNQYVTLDDAGGIALTTPEDSTWREELLLVLLATEYAAFSGLRETAGSEYPLLYERLDAGESTIRSEMSDLADRGLVAKDPDSDHWRVVPGRTEAILGRVEGAPE